MKDEVCEGLFVMSQAGDVIRDTHGNLSGRDTGKLRKEACGPLTAPNLFYIKPSGMEYRDITREDICEGSILFGIFPSYRKPSVDTLHHMMIYRNHDWINGICHTHSPYATAFALAGKSIKCVSTEQSDYFGGAVQVAAYADLNSWGEKLTFSERHGAILLQNHGCITFSDRGPVHAVKLAIALENIAMKMFLAETLHTSIRPLPDDEIKKWKDRYDNVYGQ